MDFNKDEPIHSECRGLVNQGHIFSDIHDFKMAPKDLADLQRLFATPEKDLEDVTLEQFFEPSFFEGNLWLCFHTMLAFKPYHSAIEAKRYWQRFALGCRIEYLEGIVHTPYNEYDSLIKPLELWLQDKGVQYQCDATVYDIDLDAVCNTATGISVKIGGEDVHILVKPNDLVFVTNGSMSQNACYGDNTTIAATNRDTKDRGCFTLWEHLAQKDKKFGNPEKFINDIDKTKWLSFFPTIKGYPQFIECLEEMSGSKAGTGGVITFKDSGWDMSIILHHKPFYPNQAEDEEVFWGYGLFGECEGDYIQKPMCDCNGEEIMTELLYHLGMLDMKDELLAHTYVSTCMMPYITSQFMPRKISDRPKNVPDGCTNLAFIGQYVELPGDVVFTVETSARTGLEAVYKLLNLDKDVLEVYPSKFDIRYNIDRFKKLSGIPLNQPIIENDLPKINPLEMRKLKPRLLDRINSFPNYYTMYTGRDKSVPWKDSVLNPKFPPDK